jgi:hypothetical protein
MKKGQQRYISRVCGSGTHKGGVVKLGTFVEIPNVMNRASFHLLLMGIVCGLREGRGRRGFYKNPAFPQGIIIQCSYTSKKPNIKSRNNS